MIRWSRTARIVAVSGALIAAPFFGTDATAAWKNYQATTPGAELDTSVAQGGVSQTGVSVGPTTGLPTATIPIVLNRARGSAQPSVDLTYQADVDGEAGQGWTFGFPVFQRYALWGMPEYDTTDRFSFSGQPLVPVCVVSFGFCPSDEVMPSWGAGWTYYKLQVDDSQRRFFMSPDQRTWRIEYASGEISEFGVSLVEPSNTSALEFESSAPQACVHPPCSGVGYGPFRWNLVRQFDAHGPTINYVAYRWNRVNGSIRPYLTDVYDTPPAGRDAQDATYAHHVHIEYDTQPTAPFVSNPYYAKRERRVQRIDVASMPFAVTSTTPRNQVRQYKFEYEYAHSLTANNRSLLAQVRLFSRDASCAEVGGMLSSVCPQASELPPMTMGYSLRLEGGLVHPTGDIPYPWRDTNTTSPTYNANFFSMTPMDLNQDGVPDFVVPATVFNGQTVGAKILYTKNTCNGQVCSQSLTAKPYSIDSSVDPTAFLSPTSMSLVGDWNGDATPSVLFGVTTNPPSSLKLSFAPGGSNPDWQKTTQPPLPAFQNPDYPLFGDLNGDGLLDISGPTTSLLSTRDAAGTVHPFATSRNAVQQAKIADLNGDGIPDAVRYTVTAGNSSGTASSISIDVAYYPGDGRGGYVGPLHTMATGHGLGTSPTAIPFNDANTIQDASSSVFFHDVNGDGLDDLIALAHAPYLAGQGFLNVIYNSDGTNWSGCVFTTFDTATDPVWSLNFADMDGSGVDSWITRSGFGQPGVVPAGNVLSYWIGHGDDPPSSISVNPPTPHNNAVRDGLLENFDDGSGTTTSIVYARSTFQKRQGPSWKLPIPITYVSRLRTETALTTTIHAYDYINPVYDGRLKRLRGFANFTDTVTVAPRNGTSSASTTTTQRFQIPQGADANFANDQLRQLPPLPVETTVTGADANGTYCLSTTHNQFELERRWQVGINGDGRSAWNMHQASNDLVLYDGAPTCSGDTTLGAIDISVITRGGPAGGGDSVTTLVGGTMTVKNGVVREHVRKEYSYDTYGNMVQARDLGRMPDMGAGISDKITTSHSIPINVGDWTWRVDTLSVDGWNYGDSLPDWGSSFHYVYDPLGQTTSVQAVSQGMVPLVRFHRDGLATAPLPTTAAVPTSSLEIAVLYYDSYGNVWEATGKNGHCVVSVFDSAYSQLATSSIVYTQANCAGPALVTSQSALREFAAVDLAYDTANAVTMNHYDAQGRVTSTDQSDPKLPWLVQPSSLLHDYSDGIVSGEHWVHSKGKNGERYAYFDGRGSLLFEIVAGDITGGDPSPWVVTGYTALTGNNEAITYKPWAFNSDPKSAWGLTPPNAQPYARVTRDPFGRSRDEYAPGGTLIGHADYHPLGSDTASEGNLLTQKTALDGHGRVIQSTRYTGPDSLVASATFTATGQVRTVTYTHTGNAADAINRWFTYDTLGHLVMSAEPNTSKNFSLNPFDPALQTWRYAYDDAGDIVGTSDARGCGENLSYDAVGHLVSEDYSPCMNTQPAWSPPSPNGDGTEAFYQFDGAGRLTSVADRGARTTFGYDARSRVTSESRMIARPGVPSWMLSSRYAGGHIFTRTTDYDDANRITRAGTGADVCPGGTCLLQVGPSQSSDVLPVYSSRGALSSLGSSYGDLVSKVTYLVNGQVDTLTYGDRAATQRTFTYDPLRDRLATTKLSRGASSGWGAASGSYTPPVASPPSTMETVLENIQVAYDGAGNLGGLQDLRSLTPSEWPSGAGPMDRTFSYSPARQLTNVTYSAGVDPQVSPFFPEESTGQSRAVPRKALGTRLAFQSFTYDWMDNISVGDDDQHARFDRSLGTVTPSTAKPQALGSSPGIVPTHDETGNLVNLVVSRTGACSDPDGKCSQRFVYDWDEVGLLLRARRWDYTTIPGGDPVYPLVPWTQAKIDLNYAYSQGERTLKIDSALLQNNTSVEVFPSLRLDATNFNSMTLEYDRQDPNTLDVKESLYLCDAHVIYKNESVPTLTSGHLHVLLEVGNQVGSTSTVIDKETGELVESVSYQAYGATESDYRPARWNSFGESARLSSNQEDIEVGLVYFGARYYSPSLSRWISPDPLTIHALGSDWNPYTYVGNNPSTGIDIGGLEDPPNGPPGPDPVSTAGSGGGPGTDRPTNGGGGGGGCGGNLSMPSAGQCAHGPTASRDDPPVLPKYMVAAVIGVGGRPTTPAVSEMSAAWLNGLIRGAQAASFIVHGHPAFMRAPDSDSAKWVDRNWAAYEHAFAAPAPSASPQAKFLFWSNYILSAAATVRAIDMAVSGVSAAKAPAIVLAEGATSAGAKGGGDFGADPGAGHWEGDAW